MLIPIAAQGWAGDPAIVGTYQATYSTSSNGEVYTYTNAPIGDAPTGGERRWVVVLASSRGSRINMFVKEQATGTTADVVRTGSSGTGQILSVYTLVRRGGDLTWGTAYEAPVAGTSTDTCTCDGAAMTKVAMSGPNTALTSFSGSIADTLEGGYVIAAQAMWAGSTSQFAWTGITERSRTYGGDSQVQETAGDSILSDGTFAWSTSTITPAATYAGHVGQAFR